MFDHLKELISASPAASVSTFFVLLLGILYFIWKNKDLPPGPTGFPFLGYWPFLTNESLAFQFAELMKKYGDIYSFNLMGKLYVHLGSIKSIKEAHITKADCFTVRSTDYSVMNDLFSNGVLTTNGEEWSVLRKFILGMFKEYGLTSMKDREAGPVYDAVSATVDDIRATNGSPFNVIKILSYRSADVIRRMLFNDGEITEEEMRALSELYQNITAILNDKLMLVSGEFGRYFIIPRHPGFKRSLENQKKMKECVTKMLRRHEETYREGNIRDVVDTFIQARNEKQRKGDPGAKYFTEEALISSLLQNIGDCIVTVSEFIGHVIYDLLQYPEEQEKIYKELEDVIGLDRQVTIEDKNKLPYTNAFLQEALRIIDFFSFFSSLVCTKETTLNGYRIPKGTVTIVNLWASQRDPSVFDDPHKFKPSRYLNEPGKQKAVSPVSFGIGKRTCTGESFAMTQVFLFLTTIIRNFRLVPSKGDVKKDNFFDGYLEICAHPRK